MGSVGSSNTSTFTVPQGQRAVEALDRKVSSHMEKWLNSKAKSYGYRFIKS